MPYLLQSESTSKLCYVKLTQSGNDLTDPLKIISPIKSKQKTSTGMNKDTTSKG